MAQKKDTAISISSRRQMSILLSQSREASARIRVENIIQTDICVELMEILELYAELLLARAGLLDAREKDRTSEGVGDTGLEEAAASIIYAAPRLPREVRELGIVRGLLLERFGKEFALKASADGGGGVVPKRVVEKLRVEAPSTALVEAYLTEIARTYRVDWPGYREGQEEEQQQEREMEVLEGEVADEAQAQNPGGDTQSGGRGGGEHSDKITPTPSTPIKPQSKATDLGQPFSREELRRATPPRYLAPRGTKSPISVAPPAPRSDNPSPQVKLPGGEGVKKTESTSQWPAAGKPAGKNVVGGKIPDVDELAKRFSLLKR